jgi:hypothetical protein
MARLTETIQRFIVERLAMHDTPTEVAAAVKDEFGVEVTREQVRHYDPDRPESDVSKNWRAVHAAARTRFESEVSEIPIAKRSYRLRQLQDMAVRAKARGNHVLAAQLYEQAAKEVGEAYTNRRVVIPGDPAEELARDLGITAEELRTLAAGAHAEGIDRWRRRERPAAQAFGGRNGRRDGRTQVPPVSAFRPVKRTRGIPSAPPPPPGSTE